MVSVALMVVKRFRNVNGFAIVCRDGNGLDSYRIIYVPTLLRIKVMASEDEQRLVIIRICY